MMFRATRLVLYPLFFACTVVLLGLTAYRIHYTENLDHPDVLTTRNHFYDPRIAALMVASIVGLLFSLVIIGTIVAGVDIVIGEHLTIWILWIFFLITTALVTRQFSNLKWCRSHNKVCSVLETIKAFGWICWGLLSILLVITLIKLLLGGSGSRTNRDARGAAPYPDIRQTPGSTTVHEQTRATQQPVQATTQAHGAQTKQNTHINQQQLHHQSQPTTTTTPGAMYRQDIDHPAHSTEPGRIV